jgi:O-antigen/teichoic acid export membrane protein
MLKFLLKDSLIYGLANVLQKLVPFLIIPVITRLFGSEGLKLYDLSFVYAYLFSWLIILGQDNAASVFYFSNKNASERKKILHHGLIIQLAVLALCSLLFLPLRKFFASQLFSSEKNVADFWLKALLIVPGHIVLNYVLNILLWKERKRTYLTLCFLQVAISLGGVLLTLIFTANLNWIFASLITATTVTAVVGLLLVRSDVSFPGLDKSLLKQLAWMGLPFALTSFFHQLMPSIDRYYLLHYNYGASLGQYALAVKIGGLLSMVSSAFLLAFTPYSMNRIFEKEGEVQISSLFHFVSSVLFLCIPVLLLFKDGLISFFAGASYTEAAPLLPFFFWGWAFDLLFYFSILGVYKSKKSHLMLVFFVAGTLLIAVLNRGLVPTYGIYGAAISFCAAKLFLFVLPLVLLRKHFKLAVHLPSFLGFLGAGILCSYLIYQMAVLQSVLLLLLLVGGGVFYLYMVLQKKKHLLLV